MQTSYGVSLCLLMPSAWFTLVASVNTVNIYSIECRFSHYVNKRNIVSKFGEISCFNQHNAVEFAYRFGCTRKGVHLCFIMSPGKMIFAVLEL